MTQTVFVAVQRGAVPKDLTDVHHDVAAVPVRVAFLLFEHNNSLSTK